MPAEFALGAFPVFILESPEGLFYGFPVVRHPRLQDRPLPPPAARRIDPDVFERDVFTPADEEVLRAGIAATSPTRTARRSRWRAACSRTRSDEHFVIDRLPGTPQVLIVSPCSGHGYKFASVMGEIVADLVLEGGSPFDLSMFRS